MKKFIAIFLLFSLLLSGCDAVSQIADQIGNKTGSPGKTAVSGEINRKTGVELHDKAPDLAEAHRKYLDIQYIVKGKEVMGWADLADCQLVGEFNETKDVGKYSGNFEYMTINEGVCYVAFPEDAHMPGRHLDVPNDFVKVVVKLKVE